VQRFELTYKQFYSNYNNGHVIYDGNKKIVEKVSGCKPLNVFEFGCGTGKNLNLVKAVNRWGIDLSKVAVEDGLKTYDGLDLWVGDESMLYFLREKIFDVSFTVSVLDHIPEIFEIVEQLKRISIKVFILESTDRWHLHCYPHDYGSLGFKETGYTWKSPSVNALYRMYECTGI